MSEFPSTRWSRILAPGGGRDLDALARAYERPIRAYLAAKLRLDADAAAEATQDAFAWLLATKLLDKADPARGRFRGLLKKALGNFAIERARHAATQKRGGAATHVALDDVGEPVDPRGRTPEQVLDDAWRAELLQQAQRRLQAELEQNDRALHWALFRDWFLDDSVGDGAALDHATLAARHGITRTDVSNWLDHGKRRYRALLHELVADTCTDDAELQQELQWLFGSATAGGRA